MSFQIRFAFPSFLEVRSVLECAARVSIVQCLMSKVMTGSEVSPEGPLARWINCSREGPLAAAL
jgi:hypothetical protein